MTFNWPLISNIVAWACFVVATATFLAKPRQWTFWIFATAAIQLVFQLLPNTSITQWLVASSMNAYTFVLAAISLVGFGKKRVLAVPLGLTVVGAFIATAFLKASPLLSHDTEWFFKGLDQVICLMACVLFAGMFGRVAWRRSPTLAISGGLAAITWGATTLFHDVGVGSWQYDVTGFTYSGGVLITFLSAAAYSFYPDQRSGGGPTGKVNANLNTSTGGVGAPA
jgi:hypothetical protein